MTDAPTPHTSPNQDLKALWRDQPAEETPPLTLEIIHARGFQDRIKRRNLIEYVASAFVVAAFGAYIVILPDPLLKIASGMVILGTLVVVHQLHKRGSARPVPGVDALAFHRAELVRQRDMARSVWLWYLAPFLPGLVLFQAAMILDHPLAPLSWKLTTPALTLAFFIFCWRLNLRAARRLQAMIDELDALKRD